MRTGRILTELVYLAGNLSEVANPDPRLGGLGRRGPRLCGDRSGQPPGRQLDTFAVAIMALVAFAAALDAWIPGAAALARVMFGIIVVQGFFGTLLNLPDETNTLCPSWWIGHYPSSPLQPSRARHRRDRIARSQCRRIPMPRP